MSQLQSRAQEVGICFRISYRPYEPVALLEYASSKIYEVIPVIVPMLFSTCSSCQGTVVTIHPKNTRGSTSYRSRLLGMNLSTCSPDVWKPYAD